MRMTGSLIAAASVLLCTLLFSSYGYARSIELSATASATISAPMGAGCSRILAKFDLPKALNGAEIDYAELRVPAVVTQISRLDPGVRLLRVNRSWSPDNVAWLTPWQTPGGDLVKVPGAVTIVPIGDVDRGPVPLVMDATDIVQYWADHPAENYGIAVASFDPGAGIDAKDIDRKAETISLKVYFTPRCK